MGVVPVVLFGAETDGFGDVGAGLVGVELDGAPPAGDGRGFGVDGGDRVDELADDFLLDFTPPSVPDDVDGDVGCQDWTHMVFEMDEI